MSEISDVIYRVAEKEIGTWEWAGDDHNPKVLSYFSDAGHPEIRRDEVPWCAAFAGSILAQCGLRNTGSLLARSYLRWGDPVEHDEVQKGDIVVISRGTSSWQGHVGFFAGWGSGGAKVRILGGNQNDQVNITPYNANRILGFRRARPQRQSLVSSRTAVASGATVATGAAGVLTSVSGLSEQSQTLLILMGGIVVVLGLIIFRERIKHWMEGVR